MTSPLASTLCFLAIGSGVGLAVSGMLTLSLPRIVAGFVCWTAGLVAWERTTGRFA